MHIHTNIYSAAPSLHPGAIIPVPMPDHEYDQDEAADGGHDDDDENQDGEDGAGDSSSSGTDLEAVDDDEIASYIRPENEVKLKEVSWCYDHLDLDHDDDYDHSYDLFCLIVMINSMSEHRQLRMQRHSMLAVDVEGAAATQAMLLVAYRWCESAHFVLLPSMLPTPSASCSSATRCCGTTSTRIGLLLKSRRRHERKRQQQQQQWKQAYTERTWQRWGEQQQMMGQQKVLQQLNR